MITTTVISETTTRLSTRKAAKRGQQEELRMTSLDIAELCGKQHKHVMRDIRNMEPAWEKVNGSKFGLIEYTDLRGRLKPCYTLTKTECLYIATKYDDEMRAKLVLRWEELERERLGDRQQLALPSPQKIARETWRQAAVGAAKSAEDSGDGRQYSGRGAANTERGGRGHTDCHSGGQDVQYDHTRLQRCAARHGHTVPSRRAMEPERRSARPRLHCRTHPRELLAER